MIFIAPIETQTVLIEASNVLDEGFEKFKAAPYDDVTAGMLHQKIDYFLAATSGYRKWFVQPGFTPQNLIDRIDRLLVEEVVKGNELQQLAQFALDRGWYRDSCKIRHDAAISEVESLKAQLENNSNPFRSTAGMQSQLDGARFRLAEFTRELGNSEGMYGLAKVNFYQKEAAIKKKVDNARNRLAGSLGVLESVPMNNERLRSFGHYSYPRD